MLWLKFCDLEVGQLGSCIAFDFGLKKTHLSRAESTPSVPWGHGEIVKPESSTDPRYKSIADELAR